MFSCHYLMYFGFRYYIYEIDFISQGKKETCMSPYKTFYLGFKIGYIFNNLSAVKLQLKCIKVPK